MMIGLRVSSAASRTPCRLSRFQLSKYPTANPPRRARASVSDTCSRDMVRSGGGRDGIGSGSGGKDHHVRRGRNDHLAAVLAKRVEVGGPGPVVGDNDVD